MRDDDVGCRVAIRPGGPPFSLHAAGMPREEKAETRSWEEPKLVPMIAVRGGFMRSLAGASCDGVLVAQRRYRVLLPGRCRWLLAGAFALCSAFSALGCGLGTETLEEADPAALPVTVSFDQHIKPRINYYCAGCHHPDSPLGSADGWNFSSYELVRASYKAIEEAAIEERSMPPGGARRFDARDSALFRRWRAQNFPR